MGIFHTFNPQRHEVATLKVLQTQSNIQCTRQSQAKPCTHTTLECARATTTTYTTHTTKFQNSPLSRKKIQPTSVLLFLRVVAFCVCVCVCVCVGLWVCWGLLGFVGAWTLVWGVECVEFGCGILWGKFVCWDCGSARACEWCGVCVRVCVRVCVFV
jgi:hypothetical protein